MKFTRSKNFRQLLYTCICSRLQTLLRKRMHIIFRQCAIISCENALASTIALIHCAISTEARRKNQKSSREKSMHRDINLSVSPFQTIAIFPLVSQEKKQENVLCALHVIVLSATKGERQKKKQKKWRNCYELTARMIGSRQEVALRLEQRSSDQLFRSLSP